MLCPPEPGGAISSFQDRQREFTIGAHDTQMLGKKINRSMWYGTVGTYVVRTQPRQGLVVTPTHLIVNKFCLSREEYGRMSGR